MNSLWAPPSSNLELLGILGFLDSGTVPESESLNIQDLKHLEPKRPRTREPRTFLQVISSTKAQARQNIHKSKIRRKIQKTLAKARRATEEKDKRNC